MILKYSITINLIPTGNTIYLYSDIDLLARIHVAMENQKDFVYIFGFYESSGIAKSKQEFLINLSQIASIQQIKKEDE